MQGWKQSKLIASGNQGWSYSLGTILRDRPAYSVSNRRLVTVLSSHNGAKAMQSIISDLSCCFTLDGNNYDYLEANNGKASHSLPCLELPLNSFDHASEFGPATVLEAGYRSLCRAWDNAKERALIAKGEREGLTLDAIDARDTSNRPDSIPSDMNVMRVHGWKPAHTVYIPGKPKSDGSLKDLLAKPDGMTVSLPTIPQGTILGTLSTEAWRRAEGHSIPVHAPKALPDYQHPQRDKTASELEAEAWLAMPGRVAKPASRSSRLARLQARHWDKGDGNNAIQPVMLENASLRALGRINRSIRFNRAAAE